MSTASVLKVLSSEIDLAKSAVIQQSIIKEDLSKDTTSMQIYLNEQYL
jgi:hypothetical protein